MQKNQTIVLIVIVIIILGGFIGWSMLKKSGLPSEEEQIQEEETPTEVFSMSAVVSSVDAANDLIMVKPQNQEEEVRVMISEDTKLIKLEFPFDPKNPPAEATFTPTATDVELSDFKQGDNVFIKVKENIAGKSEFDNVDFIHILP